LITYQIAGFKLQYVTWGAKTNVCVALARTRAIGLVLRAELIVDRSGNGGVKEYHCDLNYPPTTKQPHDVVCEL
jgi:hypothetical protein